MGYLIPIYLMGLPMEILVGILTRVPTKSVCCIRCVSKTLLSIVDSPSFVTLHTRFLLSPDSPPRGSPPAFSSITRLLLSSSLISLDTKSWHCTHWISTCQCPRC
ncbi:hypothetical protein M0R45_002938 [Rubus argutus]|uniref:F-box domain-containing protein n=1 Tax=Rubus argutus TaxID=59490 RepID=A0AAW1YER6_RUBAR